MNRPNSCLLVRFNFSVVILCVTVYLRQIWLFGIILCCSLFVHMCLCCARFKFLQYYAKRLAGKNISKMIYFVSHGM